MVPYQSGAEARGSVQIEKQCSKNLRFPGQVSGSRTQPRGTKSRSVSEGPRDLNPVPLGEAPGLVPKNSWRPLFKGQSGGSEERQTEIGGRGLERHTEATVGSKEIGE